MNTQKPGTGNPQVLTSALSEAQSIIEAAEKRASELRNSAERVLADAKERGYREGFKQGLTDAANNAIRLLEESAAVRVNLSEEAAKLAVAICNAVIGEQITVDPRLVQRIAERALQQSSIGTAVNIVVNPDDKSLLQAHLDQLRRVSGGATISFESDRALTRGGCIVRTEFGEVDASIESLLASVTARLGIES